MMNETHENENEKKTHVWNIPDDGQAYPWTYHGVTYAADHYRGIWTIREDNQLEWLGIYDPETDTLRKTKEPYFESDPFIKHLLADAQQWKETLDELARTQSQLTRVAFELLRAQNQVARLSAQMQQRELRIRQEVERRICQEVELRIREEMEHPIRKEMEHRMQQMMSEQVVEPPPTQ